MNLGMCKSFTIILFSPKERRQPGSWVLRLEILLKSRARRNRWSKLLWGQSYKKLGLVEKTWIQKDGVLKQEEMKVVLECGHKSQKARKSF